VSVILILQIPVLSIYGLCSRCDRPTVNDVCVDGHKASPGTADAGAAVTWLDTKVAEGRALNSLWTVDCTVILRSYHLFFI